VLGSTVVVVDVVGPGSVAVLGSVVLPVPVSTSVAVPSAAVDPVSATVVVVGVAALVVSVPGMVAGVSPDVCGSVWVIIVPSSPQATRVNTGRASKRCRRIVCSCHDPGPHSKPCVLADVGAAARDHLVQRHITVKHSAAPNSSLPQAPPPSKVCGPGELQPLP
jgi:hypothetical protein